jgi:hypothetical protein
MRSWPCRYYVGNKLFPMSHSDAVRGTALVKSATDAWRTSLHENRSCGLPVLEQNLLVFMNLQIRISSKFFIWYLLQYLIIILLHVHTLLGNNNYNNNCRASNASDLHSGGAQLGDFPWFFSILPDKFTHRPLLLPSKSFPIYYHSSIILPCCVI